MGILKMEKTTELVPLLPKLIPPNRGLNSHLTVKLTPLFGIGEKHRNRDTVTGTDTPLLEFLVSAVECHFFRAYSHKRSFVTDWKS